MRRTSVTKIGLYVVLAMAVVSGGCIVIAGGDLRCKAERTDNLTAPAGGVTTLKVTANVGAIKLEAAETSEVRITADITVKAKTDERAEELLSGVHVTAEPSGDTLVIKAEKPSGFGHNELSVDLTIAAPAGLRLECTTNVGDIRVDGFTSRVEAHTDVGKITCEGLHDSINLHTNVGDIRATYASDAPAALAVSVSTNVGNIDFAAQSQVSAHLTASSNVGDIHTDRPLTVTGSVGKSLNGTLGDGQGHVDLHTNVGSITIH